ncbi:MAG: VWA domain-containing protein [Deltaproteobacteria bacterium]
MKTNDWLFTPNPASRAVPNVGSNAVSNSSPDLLPIVFLSIFGVAVLVCVVTAIFLIIKGKTVVQEDGSKIVSPKREIGMFLLILLFVTFAVSALIIFNIMLNGLFGAVLLFILFAVSVWLFVYAIKNKAKIALIPITLIALAPIMLFVTYFVGPAFEKNNSLASSCAVQFDAIQPMSMEAKSFSENIGLSTGGAKDINNFRENIKNNYLPLPTDVTCEGLFYDYYFDTGKTKESDKLFSPSYTYAISKDPISQKEDYFLSVGLNSNIKQADFKRKKLNLAIVLDISGSMGSSFDSYYYDRVGNQNKTPDPDEGKSKIQIASKAIVGLLGHLNKDDRFGMVLYDDNAYLAKKIGKVQDADMDSIKSEIMKLESQGGTNMEAGYKEAGKLFDSISESNPEEYENRIIFLTDAMPNTGDVNDQSLLGLTKKSADKKIYTTFIGVGVDFNTDLIEQITKMKGANYYSVHSAEDFKKRMDKEFEYMVTPLVFNLSLKLDSKGYEIQKVYGSPEANEATGEIMRVNTLFPSANTGEGTKGGVILLKLKKISDESDLTLSVSYEDRTGKTDASTEKVIFENKTSDYFANTGIRKAVLLSRYANLLQDWMIDQRQNYNNEKANKIRISKEDGIAVPSETIQLGEWERQSLSLKVMDKYREIFNQFGKYFEEEMKEINDSTLAQEADILKKLASK